MSKNGNMNLWINKKWTRHQRINNYWSRIWTAQCYTLLENTQEQVCFIFWLFLRRSWLDWIWIEKKGYQESMEEIQKSWKTEFWQETPRLMVLGHRVRLNFFHEIGFVLFLYLMAYMGYKRFQCVGKDYEVGHLLFLLIPIHLLSFCLVVPAKEWRKRDRGTK